MKFPVLLFVIIGVVIFLKLRRRPAAGVGPIAGPPARVTTGMQAPTRAQTVAQMIERYAAVAGRDDALEMLEKLELDPNAPARIVNALRHAPGMNRAIDTALESRAAKATEPPKKQKQKAAKSAAKQHAQAPVGYGLRDELVPLGALPHLPPLRHMRPLPKLAALKALPPLGPIQTSAARSARSDSWRS
jgi:hypothetical protein